MPELDISLPAGSPTTLVDADGSNRQTGAFDPSMPFDPSPEALGKRYGGGVWTGSHPRPVCGDELLGAAGSAMLFSVEHGIDPPAGSWRWATGTDSSQLTPNILWDLAFVSGDGFVLWFESMKKQMAAAGWTAPASVPTPTPITAPGVVTPAMVPWRLLPIGPAIGPPVPRERWPAYYRTCAEALAEWKKTHELSPNERCAVDPATYLQCFLSPAAPAAAPAPVPADIPSLASFTAFSGHTAYLGSLADDAGHVVAYILHSGEVVPPPPSA